MPKIRNHPSTVEFGEIECCVLRSAIEDPANLELICEFIEKAQEREPKHSWGILAEIFTMDVTVRLVFIPREIHRMFYLTLAQSEKKLLTEGDKIPNCDHTINEHIKAVDNICFLMMYPAGCN